MIDVFATTMMQRLQRVTAMVPLAVLLLVIIATLFGLYLWQVNMSATAAYRLRAVEDQHQETKAALERLQLRMTQERSVEALAAAARDLGMQEPSNVHYLSPAALDVAVVLPQ